MLCTNSINSKSSLKYNQLESMKTNSKYFSLMRTSNNLQNNQRSTSSNRQSQTKQQLAKSLSNYRSNKTITSLEKKIPKNSSNKINLNLIFKLNREKEGKPVKLRKEKIGLEKITRIKRKYEKNRKVENQESRGAPEQLKGKNGENFPQQFKRGILNQVKSQTSIILNNHSSDYQNVKSQSQAKLLSENISTTHHLPNNSLKIQKQYELYIYDYQNYTKLVEELNFYKKNSSILQNELQNTIGIINEMKKQIGLLNQMQHQREQKQQKRDEFVETPYKMINENRSQNSGNTSHTKEELFDHKINGYCRKDCKGVCRCLLEMVRVIN